MEKNNFSGGDRTISDVGFAIINHGSQLPNPFILQIFSNIILRKITSGTCRCCGDVLTINVADGEELQGMLRRYLQLLFRIIRQGRIVKLLTP